MSPKLKSILYWVLLAPLVVVILFPFGVMLVTALRPREELFVYPPTWTFSRIVWENFATCGPRPISAAPCSTASM